MEALQLNGQYLDKDLAACSCRVATPLTQCKALIIRWILSTVRSWRTLYENRSTSESLMCFVLLWVPL
eukprot:6134145-Amphidinium_carterae.1